MLMATTTNLRVLLAPIILLINIFTKSSSHKIKHLIMIKQFKMINRDQAHDNNNKLGYKVKRVNKTIKRKRKL
jgi:hypothetical protein